MNVIHIVPQIVEEASGPSYVVARLCESLLNLHMKITLAVLDWNKSNLSHSFIHMFPLGHGPRRLGSSPKMQKWLYSQAKSHAIDLIHNHSLWMMPNIYSGWTAKRYNIPLICAPHGTLSIRAMQNGSIVKKIFWPFIQRPALKATTCFHATALSEYNDIRRMKFYQPVAIIPNGVDIPELKLKQNKESRTLLFLSRVHPIKGLDMLLYAWKVVQDRFPEWNLRIVGPDNGGHLVRMRALAHELNLQRVEFSGPIYGEAKIDAYNQADLFILPTYSENFGVSVAEALATGTPAIVTKGAPWEGLEIHKCGWWIMIDTDALVACLEEALSCSNIVLQEKGLRGREWMQAEYSWNQIGRKMAATYNWVCHGGNMPDWVITS